MLETRIINQLFRRKNHRQWNLVRETVRKESDLCKSIRYSSLVVGTLIASTTQSQREKSISKSKGQIQSGYGRISIFVHLIWI